MCKRTRIQKRMVHTINNTLTYDTDGNKRYDNPYKMSPII